jgi:hypothetical protein
MHSAQFRRHADVSFVMKGGVRGVIVYTRLFDLSTQHLMIIGIMQSLNCLFAPIDSMIESDDGFVANAGRSFLFPVFHDGNEFVLSEDVVERHESAILLLRFMIRSRESVTFVIQILQEHKHPLCLDFQRLIGLNNAHLCVVYSALLDQISHFLSHWRQKLRTLMKNGKKRENKR